MKNILITGSTGFLGSYLLKRFLDDEDIAPVVLVRGANGRTAAQRVADTLSYFYKEPELAVFIKRIRIVQGDILSRGLGISPQERRYLAENLDEIYHSAAMAEFRVPLEKIRKSNVDGTRNILDLAAECGRSGRFHRFNHISTVYIAGNAKGVFREDMLDLGQDFKNTYERSKFEAEVLVNKYGATGLKTSIFRPSIITGDSSKGKTSNFRMLYQPLHFFAANLFRDVPGNADTEANLIPVDTAADMIYLISRRDSSGGTYHIVNNSTVKVGRFFGMASEYFGFDRLRFIPVKDFDFGTLTAVQTRMLEPFIPYFDYSQYFDRTGSEAALRKTAFSYPAYDDSMIIRLFDYCVSSGFIQRKKHYVS
jgi:thioester reductase-like protein